MNEDAEPGSGLGEDLDLVRAAANGEPTWTQEQMQAEFDTLGTAPPFVTVRRKSDSRAGTLEFAGNPPVYFDWRESVG